MFLAGYAVTWNVVDEWNTIFRPGTFDPAQVRGRPILYGHRVYTTPAGIVLDARDDGQGLWVLIEVFDTGSNAWLRYWLDRAGEIGVSVGFLPTDFEEPAPDGVDAVFTRARLVELSLTPWPAVPGAVVSEAEPARQEQVGEQVAEQGADLEEGRAGEAERQAPELAAEELEQIEAALERLEAALRRRTGGTGKVA